MSRRLGQQRVRIRDLKEKADRTMTEAQMLIAQTKGAVQAVESKTLEVLTELLEASVTTLEQTQELLDMLAAGVTLEARLAGKQIPISLRLVIDDAE